MRCRNHRHSVWMVQQVMVRRVLMLVLLLLVLVLLLMVLVMLRLMVLVLLVLLLLMLLLLLLQMMVMVMVVSRGCSSCGNGDRRLMVTVRGPWSGHGGRLWLSDAFVASAVALR